MRFKFRRREDCVNDKCDALCERTMTLLPPSGVMDRTLIIEDRFPDRVPNRNLFTNQRNSKVAAFNETE